jgi:hypothetical protein
MLLEDMTFRTLAAAAEADKESALHSPILARGLLQGYAATQGLSIRRLVDTTKSVISLRRLLIDIKNNLHLLTRENYVSGGGLPFDPDRAWQEHMAGGAIGGILGTEHRSDGIFSINAGTWRIRPARLHVIGITKPGRQNPKARD